MFAYHLPESAAEVCIHWHDSNQSNSANLNSAMLMYERLFNYAVFRSVHSILFMETILQNHHHACMWKYVQSFWQNSVRANKLVEIKKLWAL